MVYEIKNSTVSVKADSVGAQMTSFCLNDGKELLWQGDATFWAKQSPVLFPVVGALRNNKALINGQWCEIEKHGFCRTAQFKLVNQSESEMEFELNESEETLDVYPFKFSFKVKFAVGENSFSTTYTVQNLDQADMPYCVGAHPGFNVPFEDGYGFKDYILEFAGLENISSPVIITDTSIYDYTAKKLELGEVKSIALDNELFSNDVVVFEDFNKNQISIKNPKTGKAIEMKFDEFPMIGIWKPYNEAPFLCLEPWVGSSTTTLEDDEFTNKKYARVLKSKEKESFTFTVVYK